VGHRGPAIAIAGAVALSIGCSGDDGVAVETPERQPVAGVWIGAAELDCLPTSGAAWDALVERARSDWGDPDIGDQNSTHDVLTLAGALVAARLDDVELRDRVVDSLERVAGTETDEILALSRNLLSYVVAADVVGLRSAAFDEWLREMQTNPGQSRAGIDTLLDSALRDPTNHGAHARASVVASARFLGDDETVGRVAARFRDWLGRSSDGFEWRELDWQADADRPHGINPPGATLEGVDVDGVLPEEQRRSGGREFPAPREPYVWEGLQGAVTTAELLTRAGHRSWDWESEALRRALRWLYDENDYPAEGDDRWIPWVVNARTGSTFPTESPTSPGKSIGYTDWTHADDDCLGPAAGVDGILVDDTVDDTVGDG
jgi:hypothetical protein